MNDRRYDAVYVDMEETIFAIDDDVDDTSIIIESIDDVIAIADLLNDLTEENERLHKAVKNFKEKYDAQIYLFGQLNSDFHWLREDKRDLEKENEKLNNELERLQIELKELNRKYNAFYDMTNERLSEMSFDYLIQPYKDKNMKLEDDLSFQKEMKKMLGEEIERLTEENEILKKKLGD